jgi:hypothetical protein
MRPVLRTSLSGFAGFLNDRPPFDGLIIAHGQIPEAES